MMITFYYLVKIPISFLYRLDSNSKFFIQYQKTLFVKQLTKTHNLLLYMHKEKTKTQIQILRCYTFSFQLISTI